jgi:hypothetical protein
MMNYVKRTNLACIIQLLSFVRELYCDDCNLEYKIDGKENRTIFSHFSSFDRLVKSNCSNYSVTNYLEFIPQKRVILDNKFSLQNLFTPRQIFSLKYLHFINLLGLDMHQKESIKRNNIKGNTHLLVYSSRFEFYSNQSLIDSTKCDSKLFSYDTMRFLNSFDEVQLINVIYPKVMCLFMFRDSNISALLFAHITNSFLLKNRLNFHDTENGTVLEQFEYLHLSISYEGLNRNMLNIHLFKYLNFLLINGVLNEIQMDLFSNFFNLKKIDFH